MPSPDPLTIARLFAAALDRCDFAEASHYLSPDCRYQIGGGELIGPEAIIGSYRDSAEWGSRTLEQVIYESEVEEGQDGLSVLYTDRIIHHGQKHESYSRQHLTMDENGRIVRIIHEELPGEREALEQFFKHCGVKPLRLQS